MPRPDIPLQGRFNCWTQGFDFPDVLLAACRSGKTGLLRFRTTEAEKSVVLQKGSIIFAKSSATDDRLGPFLLATDKIRFDHLIELSRFVTPEKRFGAVLVENGVLDPKALVAGVVSQVRSIVLSLFHWSEADYAFEEQELEKETITLRIPTPQLIVDGVRQVKSWRRVTTGIGSLDAVYQTDDDIEDVIQKADLDPPLLEILAELRGPKTIADACAGSDLNDFQVCQLLWGFRALDWVKPITEVLGRVSDADDASDEQPDPTPAATIDPVSEATTDAPTVVSVIPEALPSAPAPQDAVPAPPVPERVQPAEILVDPTPFGATSTAEMPPTVTPMELVEPIPATLAPAPVAAKDESLQDAAKAAKSPPDSGIEDADADADGLGMVLGNDD